MRFDPGGGEDVLHIHPVRQRAVAENPIHLAALENEGEVVWDDILDRAVGGSDDLTGVNAVPHRDVVGESKALFLLDRYRRFFLKQQRYELPEAVLRMTVEEHRLSGFDGREGAEDQYLTVLVEQWGNGVDDGLVIGHIGFLSVRQEEKSGIVIAKPFRAVAIPLLLIPFSMVIL